MQRTHSEATLDELQDILDEQGLHGGLAFLNERTPHRFTGIYRPEGDVLQNVQLFDAENPGLRLGAATPLRETYCSIVAREERPFATPDAEQDDRLTDHPGRDNVKAYCGTPLHHPDGSFFGTLCHFDLTPRPVDEEEHGFLASAAPLVMQALADEPGRA